VNKKIKACIKELKCLDCDALIVSDPCDIRYLTGYTKEGGYLLLEKYGNLNYFVSFLYMKAAQEITCWQITIPEPHTRLITALAKKIKKSKYKRVGFEGKTFSFKEYQTLNDSLNQTHKLVEVGGIIKRIRMIKTSHEIALIKKSIGISKEAFEFVKYIFCNNMGEKDLSIEIEKFLRLKGDDEIAFKPIVAAGQNTIFPHHMPTNTKIGKKNCLIDLGSKYCGYCADLTRVFFWSKMPSLFKRIYDTVLKACDLSIKNIRDGAKAGDIDKAARELIDKKGWGKFFGHGLGHGIGLSVHEPPFINPKSTDILKEGMIITIEPAIYFRDKFGIRIEDMVLVKSKKGEIISGDFDQ